MKLTLYFEGSTSGPSKIAKPTVFQVVLRGIGKSFQSAITAPRMNLTGYGNATAQSWLIKAAVSYLQQSILPSMWDVFVSFNFHTEEVLFQQMVTQFS